MKEKIGDYIAYTSIIAFSAVFTWIHPIIFLSIIVGFLPVTLLISYAIARIQGRNWSK